MRETLILLIVLLTFISCSQKSMEQQIDTIFEEFRSNSNPGVSVAIIKDGTTIYLKGFGVADIDENIFIEPKTKTIFLITFKRTVN